MLDLRDTFALEEVADDALVDLQGHLQVLDLRHVTPPLRLQEGLLSPLKHLHVLRVRMLIAKQQRVSYSALSS